MSIGNQCLLRIEFGCLYILLQKGFRKGIVRLIALFQNENAPEGDVAFGRGSFVDFKDFDS